MKILLFIQYFLSDKFITNSFNYELTKKNLKETLHND